MSQCNRSAPQIFRRETHTLARLHAELLAGQGRVDEAIAVLHARADARDRALAVRYRVHRRKVRQALASAVPPARKPPRRCSPVLDVVRDLIDEMLRADLAAPVKQRHTCRRIFQRLVDEHSARISYSSVVNYVGHRRPQIIAEARDRAGVLDAMPGR